MSTANITRWFLLPPSVLGTAFSVPPASLSGLSSSSFSSTLGGGSSSYSAALVVGASLGKREMSSLRWPQNSLLDIDMAYII